VGDNPVIKAAHLRALAVEYAWHWIGTPYVWGGDDFSGYDCSGLVVEILQGVGRLAHGRDYSADALLAIFRPNAVAQPYAGCLKFWLDPSGRAVHVELVIDEGHTIGASGGGSLTTTPAEAVKQNAFVKLRPLTYRSGPSIIVDPFQGWSA